MRKHRGYTIEAARPEHVGHLPALERAAAAGFPDHVISVEARAQVQPIEALAAAQAEGRLWVALAPDRAPVGFALVEIVAEHAVLAEVDVHPNHQRRGVGRALIETVIAWARAEMFCALTLTTFASLPWNAPFYERLGFRRLDGPALNPSLAHRLHEEARQGLADRVAMRLDLLPERSP